MRQNIPVCGFGFLFLYAHDTDFKTYLFEMKDFPGMRETIKESYIKKKTERQQDSTSITGKI